MFKHMNKCQFYMEWQGKKIRLMKKLCINIVIR